MTASTDAAVSGATASAAPRRHRIPARSRARWRLMPWWAKVVVVFALSRIVTTAILLGFASIQGPNAWTGAHPDYYSFAGIWDGNWYHIIEAVGYPTQLPVDANGVVQQNAWAFMPAYPALVRVFMLATGGSFDVVAVWLSVAFALAGALAFHKLMSLVLPRESVLFSVVLFCVAPLTPLFQVAYAESMHTFLLIVALYLLVRRQYWMLLPIIAVASLTRPSGLAFALALGVHVIVRWFTRARDPFPRSQQLAAVVATLFSAAAGVAWVVIAWLVTGSLTAYTDTELSWRSSYIGQQHLLPFTPWIQGFNWWFGWFGLKTSDPFGGIVLVALVVALGFWLCSRFVKVIGTDLRIWVASYLVYLLAVFFPQSSTFRLLIPTFPLLGAFAQPKSLVYRVSLVVGCVLLQIGWVFIAYWVAPYDWTPP